VTQETATQNAAEVTEALNELKAQGVSFDIQVCPKCKSPKIKRAQSTNGDMLGNMGIVQPKHECADCGWQGHLVLKATNKAWSVRDVELIREAMEIEDKESS
jgi:ssDNA-binding Zn-finger/Zn-ribbon topoisomerase 1